MSIILYALDGCPDCERVMDALEAHDVEYDVHWVEPEFSTRDVVYELTNQRSVPVLEDEDRSVVMANTDRIVEYVERTVA